MKYSTIRIEGSILSADILDKISRDELSGQTSNDFGLPVNRKVKDEIARAWADAQDMWRVYKRRVEGLAENEYGTSETRKFWIIPLLEMFGFDTVFAKSETVNGNSYAISHRANNLDQFPIHIMGLKDSLDKKRSDSGPRMSPHGLVQEYLNLTEHLYAVVANGNYLRLLRDSSRLIKLSFIEFDLASMMDDEHFADFAIMYRLLHASRMPQKLDQGADSLIEKYHQDALDSGSRIRDGLSKAVEESIRLLGDGFLAHHDNEELRDLVSANKLSADDLYEYLLKLIYRLLFLMVIEERDLVYPKGCSKEKRQIYYSFYSVANLRSLSEKPYLADHRFNDLWINLRNCFALFDKGGKGEKLGIKPLAGDLFGSDAIGLLSKCSLDNKTLLTCLRNLNIFENPVTKQKMRVNYGSLNVEEFGSVYEGLLEKDPVVQIEQNLFSFSFKAGDERSSSGSHYTPDELVQPLIKHSLDHIIEEKLKSSDPVTALLSVKVCDVACGSGHILLNAARRIGGEVAKLRSGEEQPSPEPFRQGVRDAISHCIYGVDKTPLAVELCKVALWLEAHEPGKPLSFLDHHIKCGDAIVGLAHKEELENGIANEAFKKLVGDDKDVAKRLRDKNKNQIKKEIIDSKYIEVLDKPLVEMANQCREVHQIDQQTPDDVELVKTVYQDLVSGEQWLELKTLADIQVAQFFISKTEDNEKFCITHLEYKDLLEGRRRLEGMDIKVSQQLSLEKRFFHWFLEFPEVFEGGGFDCILGNPPYLGKTALSGTFGYPFLNYANTYYTPASGCDLVTYFLRRAYQNIKRKGFNAVLTTNSISEGATKEGGLDVIANENGTLNFVQRSVRWPGVANLYVSLLSIYKGKWDSKCLLDNKEVEYINTHFEDYLDLGTPYILQQHEKLMYQGTKFLGDGFLLNDAEVKEMLSVDPKNREVIFPVINGKDVNDSYEQKPKRNIINFFEWSEEKAKEYELPYKRVLEQVRPVRLAQKDKGAKELWWRYIRPRPELYSKLRKLDSCFVVTCTTKYLNFSKSITNRVFTHALFVYASDSFYKFAIIQSSIHNEWARKYSSTLETRLRYSPSNCFETFPFPQEKTQRENEYLKFIGEEYHEFRSKIMHKLKLGLTKTYNMFHDQTLDIEAIGKAIGQDGIACEEAFMDVLHLRKLHKELDNTVIKTYGWTDIDLAHDFYDMEYLPENDRTRYTISPEARKEILNRLLLLNHEIHAEESAAALEKTVTTAKRTKRQKQNDRQLSVFDVPRKQTTVDIEIQVPKVKYDDLPDKHWEKIGPVQNEDFGFSLAAIIKLIKRPMPSRWVRLAVIFSLEPRLLTPLLSNTESAQWKRLIGGETNIRSSKIQDFIPRANHGWGEAVKFLRGNGFIIEDLSNGTWAPGKQISNSIITEGWPDGRAQFIVNFLTQNSLDEIIKDMPEVYQEWINAKAA